MEKEDNLDSPFNFYQNNLPSTEYINNINKNTLTYTEIFNSRNYFKIIDLNENNIKIPKQSLKKIAKMINIKPEDYIYFINYNKNKVTSLYLFKREEENNIIFDENIKNKEINDDNIEEGFKKVENLEDNFFDPVIYKRSFCFYIFLIFCSIWDFFFYLYIINMTIYKKHIFTIFTLILTLFLLFTGIFGIIKSKIKDFSGYILKICTILVPIFIVIGIIIYLSCDIELNLYWVKIIIDVLTIVISIILIAFITGLIKSEIIVFSDKDNDNTNNANYSNDNNNEQINQNLINDNNSGLQNNIDAEF